MTSPSAPLKVALIGCGTLAKKAYVPTLTMLESRNLLKLVWIVDQVMARSQEIQTHFPEAECLSELDQLLSVPLDLAIVATPSDCHSFQTIALLNSGISVLCEKPMATSLADAELMLEAQSKSTARMAIGLVGRFWPALSTIHRIIEQGILGEVVSVEMTRSVSDGVLSGKTDWAFRKSRAGGGVLLDVGVHHIDQMIWWLGMPESIDYRDDALGGVEASCEVEMKFPNGASGRLKLHQGYRVPMNCSIRLTKGWIENKGVANCLNLGLYKSGYSFTGATDMLPAPFNQDLDQICPQFFPGQEFVSQLENVAGAIHGLENVRVTGEEAIKSLKVIETCYQNRKLISMPWLSDSEMPEAVRLNGATRKK